MSEQTETEMVNEEEELETEMVNENEGEQDLAAELERVRRALKKANAEAAKRRKRLEELEEQEKKRKEAELSEMEKLQQQLAEALQEKERLAKEARERALKAAIAVKAAKLNFVDPEDAYKLITVEDEDDVEEALKALAKAKPYLLKKKAAPNVNASNGRGQADEKNQPDEKSLRQRFGI